MYVDLVFASVLSIVLPIVLILTCSILFQIL